MAVDVNKCELKSKLTVYPNGSMVSIDPPPLAGGVSHTIRSGNSILTRYPDGNPSELVPEMLFSRSVGNHGRVVEPVLNKYPPIGYL